MNPDDAGRRPALGRSYPAERWCVALTLAWLTSVTYVWRLLPREWVPHDEGALGQSAARVLFGEMPHRDFAEIYTGGLSYYHAVALSLFGNNLLAIRYGLLFAFTLWLPAFFYCASRFVSPVGAVALTVLATVWSVPNYPAAVPSWYNLFLATFGVACLLRHTESRQSGWLFLAGLFAGLSLLIKIVGLYFLAAALLFILISAGRPTRGVTPPSSGFTAYRLTVGALLSTAVAILAVVVARPPTFGHVYHFLVPSVVLALLGWRVSTEQGRTLLAEVTALGRLVLPFLSGLALPTLAFALLYAKAGALHALLLGVFVSPTRRLVFASLAPASWVVVVPAIGLAGLLTATVTAPREAAGIAIGGWGALILGLWALAGPSYLYRLAWCAFAESIPLLVIIGGLVLVQHKARRAGDTVAWGQSFLVLAATGLCSLIQYPFDAPIYFCYTAPLMLLAFVAVWRQAGLRRQPVLGLLTVSYTIFAVAWLNSTPLRAFGLQLAAKEPLEVLSVPAGGLHVPQTDAREYVALVRTVQAHARGRYVYAGPDAPEVYFLSSLRNPTRTIFDFLEPGSEDAEPLLSKLSSRGVSVVVINHEPKFSPRLQASVLARLADLYPDSTNVGKFTIRWKD